MVIFKFTEPYLLLRALNRNTKKYYCNKNFSFEYNNNILTVGKCLLAMYRKRHLISSWIYANHTHELVKLYRKMSGK